MASKCAKLIKAAARHGDISDAQAEGLLERLDRDARRRAAIKGQKLSDALHDIAGELVASDQTHDLIRQRNVLLSHLRLNEAMERIKKTPRWEFGLTELLEDAYNSGGHIGRSFISRLVSRLEEAQALPVFRAGRREDGLALYRELHRLSDPQSRIPVADNPQIKAIASAFYDLNRELNALKNRHGAYNPESPGWILPQTHDSYRIRKAGSPGFMRKADIKRSHDAYWAMFEAKGWEVDWERTLDGEDMDAFKSGFHASLYTKEYGPGVDGFKPERFKAHGSLANRVSSERVLWFKDPDSAFGYNEVFGNRNWNENMTSVFTQGGRHAAIMEYLGPNPANNLKLLVERLNKDRRDMPDPDKHAIRAKRIDQLWSVLNGESGVSDRPGFSTFIDNVKALQNLSKLGTAWVSAFADPVFLKSAMARHGIGQMERWIGTIEAMIPRGEGRQEAIEAIGFAADAIINNINGRFSNDFAPWRAMRKLSDIQFKIGLLSPWTHMWERGAGEMMSYQLGRDGASALSDLAPLRRRHLEAHGITETDWDLIRSNSQFTKQMAEDAGVKLDDAKPFIGPDAPKYVPDEAIAAMLAGRGDTPSKAGIDRWRDKAQAALGAYFQDFIREAVPRTGLREKAFMSQGLRRGTMAREALELFFQFKSFPLALWNTIRRNTGEEFSDVMPRLWLVSMAAQATIAGYVSITVKDWLAGRNRRPLDDPATIKDAMLKGGASGIIGDIFLNDFDSNTRSFLKQIAGPSFGELDSLMSIFSEAEGLATGREGASAQSLEYQSYRLLERNTPFANLWYLKPFLNYFVFYAIREHLSPGSLKKMERHIEQQKNQEFFAPPSDIVRRPPGERMERAVELYTE